MFLCAPSVTAQITSASSRAMSLSPVSHIDANLLPVERSLRYGFNGQVLKEMQNAWRKAGAGISKYEVVVLLYKRVDGSLFAETQEMTAELRRSSFHCNAAVFAILHTHPNVCDPKPSEIDRESADKLRVPIVTLTSRGMYVYDPATKITRQLKSGLEWYTAENWNVR
jgi:proteasome lid subunit RPN8/RPN11